MAIHRASLLGCSLVLALACSDAGPDGGAADTHVDDVASDDVGSPEADAPGDPGVESVDDVPAETVVDAPGDAADDTSGDLSLPPWPDGSDITCEEVWLRVQAGDPDMLLVNVVDEEFYDLGHIEGSLVIPWDLIEGRLDEVDPGRHVVLYCRRGVRSATALATLTTNGYEMVWVMEGGLEQWISLEYPTVPDP